MRKCLTVFFLVISALVLFNIACNAQTKNVELTFVWTASGDDGTTGTASHYDIRYGKNSLADSTAFLSATQVPGCTALIPLPAGTSESWTTTINLECNQTYYFAMRVGDEIINWSPISNVIFKTTQDCVAPAAIIDFGFFN